MVGSKRETPFMEGYRFGMHCERQWTSGSAWMLVSGDGHVLDDGEIVEAEPPRRLVIRWQHQNRPELKAEGESLCTMAPRSYRSRPPRPISD
jgi:uncharacterized protein YndB with AHSA1/START domain